MLEAGKDLLAVGCFCIGTNQVDLGAAAERGVAVFNAPFSNTRSVVELVLGEIIALVRRLPEKNARMHEGVWDKSARGSHEFRGRTLGIVGYGNIGTQLSNIAEAVGLRVIFFDTADRLAHGNARKVESLEALLAEADVVSLHVDGRPGNAGLFGAEQFALMKPRLDLHQRLARHGDRRRVVAGAPALGPHRRGGDRRVPDRAQGPGRRVRVPVAGPGQRHPDPARRRLHPGGAGGDRRLRLHQAAAVRRYGPDGAVGEHAGGRACPRRATASRMGYLHTNTPGVLAGINQVLLDSGVNVVSQALSTRGERGYVLTDTDSPVPEDALAELRRSPHTVWLRTWTP